MGVKKKVGTSSGVVKKGTTKRKKGGSGILTILAVVLAVAIIGSTVVGVIVSPSRGQCKEIIDSFQTACNNLDANGVVRCMKPSVLTTALNIGTALAGDEATDAITQVLGSGIDMMGLGTEETIESLFQTMEIQPKKFGFPQKTRKVRCKAMFGVLAQYVDIYVTKYEGDVYITKVKFSK